MGLEQFKRNRTPLAGVALGTVIGLLVAYAMAVILPWRAPPQRPDFAAAGDAPKRMFKSPHFVGFVNQLGNRVGSQDFSGKVVVVTFMYPFCTRGCPIIASHIVNLERLLRERDLQGKVRFLSFNVDPSDSTPRLMSQFMSQYGADPADEMWQFLMASPKQTDEVVKQGYHASFEKIPTTKLEGIFKRQRSSGAYTYVAEMSNPLATANRPDYTVLHTTSAIIVGPKGVVRYVLSKADTISVAAVLNDIIRVLRTGKPV
ncbi:hypothetical protein BJI67_01985 [Acidihalobacter aeolianus]|uniref:Thioredoxin domain-containing protein n=1 Tax=Acidihalobacter aeolianus TaxID=2792603 RepID=A0A1D8K4W4_9GAMM|nr:SCO family protein [Acidihalobacter aeolianus]AOV16003.1 hypothetical protein BJI67_01985 [Acidihalobacter aeolianus]